MKKIILVLLLVFNIQYAGTVIAEECMEGNCDDGIGTGFTEDEKIYSGEWRDGLPHGIGKLTVSKDKQIEGRWEKGELVEEKSE